MMCLELIAEFDPFLQNHLSQCQNSGKGSTSYLSHSTYEELIHIMARKVISEIVKEIQEKVFFYYC